MSQELAALKNLIEQYLAGQIPFWTFHNSFIEDFVRLPDGALGGDALKEWDEAYELVYMSAPDPLSPEEEAAGIIGEAALKRELGLLSWEELPDQ